MSKNPHKDQTPSESNKKLSLIKGNDNGGNFEDGYAYIPTVVFDAISNSTGLSEAESLIIYALVRANYGRPSIIAKYLTLKDMTHIDGITIFRNIRSLIEKNIIIRIGIGSTCHFKINEDISMWQCWPALFQEFKFSGITLAEFARVTELSKSHLKEGFKPFLDAQEDKLRE
ncbi:MAG: hypothetical protein HQK95_09790 [Nitrospirae bacterium]|nr:hypothetical protein [Nitrospirota bacterium]